MIKFDSRRRIKVFNFASEKYRDRSQFDFNLDNERQIHKLNLEV